MLRYWTAGESHGKTLLALVDGFPAGIELDLESINYELKIRQGGYGRGGRQKIETDQVEAPWWESASPMPAVLVG